MKKKILYSICLATILYANENEQFNLGQIDISEEQDVNNKVEILSEDIQLHNFEDISEALSTQTGVFLSNSGSRAEKTISIRGFDSTRTAVFIDGIQYMFLMMEILIMEDLQQQIFQKLIYQRDFHQ